MKQTNLIIQGNSSRCEFVHCFHCGKEFVWLKAYVVHKHDGWFYPVCRKCALKKGYIK